MCLDLCLKQLHVVHIKGFLVLVRHFPVLQIPVTLHGMVDLHKSCLPCFRSWWVLRRVVSFVCVHVCVILVFRTSAIDCPKRIRFRCKR